MARTRIIEGKWNCSSCGAKGILARYKSCPTCGSPREASGAESKFDFGAANAKGGLEREAVTEIAALSLAAAGVDWFCSFCGASNRGDHEGCRTCGAARADTAAAVGPPAPPARRGLWKKLILAVVVTFSGCMGWGYWLLQTRDYEGVVQSVSWDRTLTRQAFTPVQQRGWQDQLQERESILPVNGLGEFVGTGNIRDCVEKQRGTRQVAVGSKQVCTTKSRSVACGSHESCSTRDLGNGYAEEVCHDVTDYCSERYEDCRDETQYRTDPVFAQECAFDTYEWQQLDHRSARGGRSHCRRCCPS